MALLLLATTTAARSAPAPTPGPVLPAPAVVDGHPLAEVLAPDQIRALDAPMLVPAARAAMADDEAVIGVVVGSDARAYSLRRLDWHEVVNDRAFSPPRRGGARSSPSPPSR